MFNHKNAKRLVEMSRLKRSAIASEARIKDTTLTKYLNGEGNPSTPVVALLAIALKVPESELWTDGPEDKQKAS